MRSPFPGMDPYLEQHWLDVRHRLATYACDQLQRKLPRDLHADVRLDLQALIDQCYENGGYDIIDYRRPVQPPLDPADLAWADEWLKTKGMR